MSVGGDPDELVRAAAGGPGQAFTLDRTAGLVAAADTRHRARVRSTAVDARGATAGLRWLGGRITRLDAWVLRVAAALRGADVAGAATLRARLLAFGPTHPAAHLGGDEASAAELPVVRLSSADLDTIAAWSGLPGAWRDRVHRERMRRWLDALDDRIAAATAGHDGGTGPLARLVEWIDHALVDRSSVVIDLHRSPDEEVARLRAEAAGVRRLLADPRLTVWSFTPRSTTPSGGPAVRVAFGDPGRADHLAVVVPGTATGPHAPGRALRDAAALHQAAVALAASDTDATDGPAATDATVATVVDLHDAPMDLGRAADPRTGRAAGRATADFLAGLPDHPRRTTLVGHSYGAYTAAHAARAARAADTVDALVLLGAPGTGVLTRDALPTREVWAARAPDDPIAVVADLDELVRSLPVRLRPRRGPLADPLVGLGPDPTDHEFGARRLSTGRSATGAAVRGHLDYLTSGTAVLERVAGIVRGLPLDP